MFRGPKKLKRKVPRNAGNFFISYSFKQVLNELIKFAKWLSEKWNGEMDDGNGDRTDE
jgi:hypothetical protein